MLSQLRRRKLARFFEVLDHNHDGILDPEDFEQTIQKILKMREWKWNNPEYEELQFFWTGFSNRLQVWADRNGDGKITPKEWFWYLEQMLDNFEARYIKKALVSITVTTMDFNQDKQISCQEFSQFCQIYEIEKSEAYETFSKLDLNEDGYLTEEELIKLLDEFLYSEDPQAKGNWFFGNF